MQDFADVVRLLDAQTFVTRYRPPARIVPSPEYPLGSIPGARVGMVGSYLSRSSARPNEENVMQISRTIECYLLWEKGVLRKLGSSQFSGYGDADIKRFWFLTAIGLVRGRVLYRRKWFPACRIRTLQSARRKYAVMCGDDVFIAFQNFSDMTMGRSDSRIETDMLLTQFLVASLSQKKNAASDGEIQELLTSS